MKLIKYIFCLMCCFCAVFAEDSEVIVDQSSEVGIRNAYTHLDLGLGPFPLPIPSFALGHRNQWGHHGLDVSLYASTVVYITQVKLTPAYFYYFTPNLQSQFYLGMGLGTSALFESKKSFSKAIMCLSPEVILGKEYRNEAGDRRFFQAQISFPTYEFGRIQSLSRKHHTLYYPLVVLSYGICF